jgi:hypothetical protein
MKNTYLRVFSLAIFLVIFSTHIPVANAGGSSFSTDYEGNTVFVKPGAVAKNVQRVFLQTYFPVGSNYNQFVIDKVNVVCTGDNIVQSAQFTIAGQVYGSGVFKRIVKSKTYETSIVPQKLVLSNNSIYTLGLNIVTKKFSQTWAATCKISKLTISGTNNGLDFTPVDESVYGYSGTSFAGVVVATDLKKHASYVSGDNLNLNSHRDGFIRGTLNFQDFGKYQLSVNYRNWDNMFVGGTLLFPGSTSTNFLFDVKNSAPLIASKPDFDFDTYYIKELHLYDAPQAGGAVGSLVIER